MKKTLIALLILSACAAEEVVSLNCLNNAQIQQFCSGSSPHMILECPKGATLPFEVLVQGEFLSSDAKSSLQTISVAKSCFIKRQEETFLFSIDGDEWQPFEHFFTGIVAVKLGNNDGLLRLSLTLELNVKE